MYTIKIGKRNVGLFPSAISAVRYGMETFEPYGFTWDWEPIRTAPESPSDPMVDTEHP